MNNLRKYRKLNKLTQVQLAKLAGMKWHTFISQCENGEKRLPFDLGKKLAKVLNVDVYELMGDDVYKKGVEKNIVHINGEEIRLNASSLEVAFDDFISRNAYLLEPEDKRDDPKDIAIFRLLNVLNENFRGMTSEDVKSVQKAVIEFIQNNHLNKSAIFEFQDELGLNSGDKNKGEEK